jgi:quinol monooxygenase YgiN
MSKQEAMMHMRIFRAQAQPGTVDELAKRMQEFLDTTLRGTSGLEHLYCGGDRSSNQVSVVSLWDSEQSMTEASPKVQAFAAQVRDLLAEQPTVTGYEVVIQL